MILRRSLLFLTLLLCLSAMLLPSAQVAAAPDLEVNKNSVDLGEISAPASDTSVYVYNADTACFTWEITGATECWLTVAPASGSDNFTCDEDDYLEIQVDPSCLGDAPGPYSGSFRVSSVAVPGDFEDISVSFTYKLPANLEVNENTVDFGDISAPASDTSVYVYNTGTVPFDWTVSESVSWLTVAPMSGTTSTEQDTLTIDVDPSGVTSGQLYQDIFTVTRDGAPGDSETVTVSFTYVDATEIALSGTPLSGEASGDISVTQERDWYYFDVPAGEGGNWNMWTAAEPSTVLSLYTAVGAEPLATNDNCDVPDCDLDHTEFHSRIDFALTAGTRYYLMVRAPGMATFSYTVKVRKEPVPDNYDPELTTGDVAPDSGDDSTTFTYTVDYYDQDGDAPDIKDVYIDGTPYAMALQSGTADDGTYRYQTTGADLGAGGHQYYFSFTDGQGGSDRLPSSGTKPGPALDFGDVPPDHWAHDEIVACSGAGIVSGYGEGLYQPTWPVSRDQMAVFMSRALAGGDDNVPDGPTEATFNDVPTDNWAYKYVEYCVANGVVQGFDEVTYGPTVAVSRASMAVFIARAVAGGDGEVPIPPVVPTFNDVPTQHWAYKYIEYCAAEGIVHGYDPTTYGPEVTVGRAQMAVFISRAFSLT